MFTLAWPLFILLLPLPLFVREALTPAPNQDAALKAPFFPLLQGLPGSGGLARGPAGNTLRLLLLWLVWLLIVFAACRPQFIGDPVRLPQEGRNIMLGIDLSGSMEMDDFSTAMQSVRRLDVVKKVADDFIEKRPNDRIGLVVFGERAHLLAPPTFDHTTVRQFLAEADIGMAGRDTAIGDAIGLMVKYAKDKTPPPVLILLTDGENTAGTLPPLKAAELAAEEEMRIHAIGMGSKNRRSRTFFGLKQLLGQSQALDETTLKAIAAETGGQYFRAHNTNELIQIYDTINEIEPTADEGAFFRPRNDLFHWPLGIAFLLSPLLFLRLPSRRRA